MRAGHAYVAEDHVLFDVASMPDYGRLANRSLEEMEAGARVDVAPYKKGPWTSCCGSLPNPATLVAVARGHQRARPSRLAHRVLGHGGEALWAHVFDIHGGGIDLVFPHHENEIAQSRCAHGTPVMANYWMHNGFLTGRGREDEQVARQLHHDPCAAGSNWPRRGAAACDARRPSIASPIAGSERSACGSVRRTLDHWYELTADAADGAPICADVLEALEDDLNTPQAIAALACAAVRKRPRAAKPAAAA